MEPFLPNGALSNCECILVVLIGVEGPPCVMVTLNFAEGVMVSNLTGSYTASAYDIYWFS